MSSEPSQSIVQTPLPDWLTGDQKLPSLSKETKQLQNQLTELQYENMFESVLDKLAEGRSLRSIFADDYRNPDYAKFLRWVHKDKVKLQKYYDAQIVGAEVTSVELIEIADALDNTLEDVQRSTLRINTRKFVMGVWNRHRFGDIKQVEMTTVDIGAALADARARTSVVYDTVAEIINTEEDGN